jgi:hypothetical protein
MISFRTICSTPRIHDIAIPPGISRMTCYGFSVKAADYTMYQAPSESMASAHDSALLVPDHLDIISSRQGCARGAGLVLRRKPGVRD